MTQGTWPGRDEIVRRARRRWLWTVGATVVFAGVLVPLLVPVLGTHRHSTTHHRHSSGALIVTLLVASIVLVAGIGVLVWMGRKMWRGTGRFAPPLTAGLPRTQRRQVVRAIRRGVPSTDVTLASVEYETATRLAGQIRFGIGLFATLIVLGIVEALVPGHTTAGRVYFSAITVAFVAALVLHVRLAQQARRYLSAASAAQP